MLGASELALSLEKLNFSKLRALRDLAEEVGDTEWQVRRLLATRLGFISMWRMKPMRGGILGTNWQVIVVAPGMAAPIECSN